MKRGIRHPGVWALSFCCVGAGTLGCSGGGQKSPGSGGLSSFTGGSGAGGAPSSGGSPSNGGVTTTGGVASSGGITASGGVAANGGFTSSGGTLASGGSPANDASAPSNDAGIDDAGTGGRGTDGVTVRIATGTVHGVLKGNSRRFLGIPFAEPPLGPRRFLAPAAAKPWQGTREATTFGHSCMQGGGLVTDMSEDCLTVNVFAPASTPATPLPVMVFIYGGGFVAGASLGYESQPLREVGNVVVVTLNYRLGAFGFLEHPALAAAGAPYSNQGLRDQQLALQWVQDNVHVFGGDPNDVTVFGESAGSVSTCAHLFARGSEGLGKKFILESGSCVYGGLAIQARSLAASAGDTVAKKHCSGAADVLACLRAVPATDLVTTTVETADPVVKGYFPWVDGDLFAEAPEALLAKGKLTKGPLLAGTNQFEWYLWQSLGVTPSFLNRTAMQAQIQRYFPANAGAVGNRYLPANDLDAQSAFTRLMTDYYFRCPTRALLRGALAHGSTGYLYDFQVAPAAHALEVDYVFDELAVTPLFPFQAPNPLTRSVVSAMQAYWTAFARHGDPNTSSLLKWPAYDAVTDQHIVLREPLAISKDGAAKDCDFWDELWGLKAP